METLMETLKSIGTPWAETYIGSGRFTGNLASEPVYTDIGDVAPGWSYVGAMTPGEFNEACEWQVHRDFHSSNHSDFACEFCVKAGWVTK